MSDRLRSKIEGCLENLERVREEEGACNELAKAFPDEDHSYPHPGAEGKLLDRLRDLFKHWTTILGLPITENSWIKVHSYISSIDRMRVKANNKNEKIEKQNKINFALIDAPINLQLLDADEQHDLFLFEEEDCPIPRVNVKHIDHLLDTLDGPTTAIHKWFMDDDE
jgi:hypothetical protein